MAAEATVKFFIAAKRPHRADKWTVTPMNVSVLGAHKKLCSEILAGNEVARHALFDGGGGSQVSPN